MQTSLASRRVNIMAQEVEQLLRTAGEGLLLSIRVVQLNDLEREFAVNLDAFCPTD